MNFEDILHEAAGVAQSDLSPDAKPFEFPPKKSTSPLAAQNLNAAEGEKDTTTTTKNGSTDAKKKTERTNHCSSGPHFNWRSPLSKKQNVRKIISLNQNMKWNTRSKMVETIDMMDEHNIDACLFQQTGMKGNSNCPLHLKGKKGTYLFDIESQ